MVGAADLVSSRAAWGFVVKILIVEDAAAIAEQLAQLLATEGFVVEVAGTVAQARLAIGRSPDLVILDWGLPDGQGIELLKEWRRGAFAGPVLFLTARVEVIDRVLGLELGADDYITKPFHPRELVARVKARLRGRDAALSCAVITLDLATRTARFDGVLLTLTKLEFDLLRVLVEHPDRVFSRDELLNRVWGYDSYPTTRTVDTHILQLRQKTKASLFETVRGVGYRLRSAELTKA